MTPSTRHGRPYAGHDVWRVGWAGDNTLRRHGTLRPSCHPRHGRPCAGHPDCPMLNPLSGARARNRFPLLRPTLEKAPRSPVDLPKNSLPQRKPARPERRRHNREVAECTELSGKPRLIPVALVRLAVAAVAHDVLAPFQHDLRVDRGVIPEVSDRVKRLPLPARIRKSPCHGRRPLVVELVSGREAFDLRNLARDGWGARIRTWEWRYQKPLPYHLATPQSVWRVHNRPGGGWQHRFARSRYCPKRRNSPLAVLPPRRYKTGLPRIFGVGV